MKYLTIMFALSLLLAAACTQTISSKQMAPLDERPVNTQEDQVEIPDLPEENSAGVEDVFADDEDVAPPAVP